MIYKLRLPRHLQPLRQPQDEVHPYPNVKALGHLNTLSVLSKVPNRVMSEMVLDGGGHFIPAGIFGLHTLSLLLSSRAEHDRATGNTRDTHKKALTLDEGSGSSGQGLHQCCTVSTGVPVTYACAASRLSFSTYRLITANSSSGSFPFSPSTKSIVFCRGLVTVFSAGIEIASFNFCNSSRRLA